jgi:hypothetical protein
VAVAFEEHGVQVLLQGPDLTAQRGLGDVQPLRRAAEVQQLGDRHEVADLPQVEVHGRPFRRRGGDAFRVSPAPKQVLDDGLPAAAGWNTSSKHGRAQRKRKGDRT